MKILSIAIACALLVTGAFFINQTNHPLPVTHTSQAAPIPEITTPKTVTNPPELTAQSIYILDELTETELYVKNGNLSRAPASTTKMMTALIAGEVYDTQSIVIVPRFTVEGHKIGIFAGETVTVESLLYATLVESANDAAEALARVYPEGRAAFVEQMNLKAQLLGMRDTAFKNPTGLDEIGHVSSVHDMALLGSRLMKNPELSQIVGTTKGSIASADGKSVHRLLATNELLSTVPGVMGIKTGWTEAARENLVTYVTRDGHPVVIALFGSDDRFGETKQLIDWVYANTQW